MEECLSWLYAKKDLVETGPYGWTRETIEQSLTRQKELGKEIDDYRQVMKKTTDELSESDKETCEDLYFKVKQTSKSKIHCLENLWEITAMQGYCVEFSRKFDHRAVHLVKDRTLELDPPDTNNSGFVAPSSQDCVFATRDSWDWLVRLVGCIDVHLKNAAEYQQFFHEVDETGCWMRDDIMRLFQCFNLASVKGSNNDGEQLYEKLQELVTAFRQWQAKTQFLWHRATRLYPIKARTEPLEGPVPARIIADYKGPEYSVRKDEDVLLLDNSDAQLWRVRNARNEEGVVPAACLVIPGPDHDAMEEAARLRMQLLAAWTHALKNIGKTLLVFLLRVFKAEYDENEMSTMRSISMMDRQDLLRTLNYIDNTMKVHWKDHEGFQNLQERLLMLRMILESMERGPITDENAYKALVVQMSTLEKLFRQYEDLWREWETNKTSLETSQAPELMLMLDKWEQLEFVSPDKMAKLWVNELPFTEEERALADVHHMDMENATISEVSDDEDHLHSLNGVERMSSDEVVFAEASSLESAEINGRRTSYARYSIDEDVDGGLLEEGVSEFGAGFEEIRAQGVEQGGASFGYATETKTAKTEQLSSVEGDESRKFVIKYVVDSSTGENISLDDAVAKGILKPDEGLYYNSSTGEQIPIPLAMTEGFIKVSFSTVKRGKEKKSSIGIITVQTERVPVRPYQVLSVKDTRNNEQVSKEEAEKRGILAIDLGLYKDSRTGQEYHVPEAAEKDLVTIEYTGPQPEKEVLRQSYAVRAAVDRRNKKIISFQSAVVRGIIDKESGAFKDTSTGTTMYIGDAIMKGYLKARKIDNPKSMDIDPQNQMVVNATEKIRKMVVEPLKVINAMRKSGEFEN